MDSAEIRLLERLSDGHFHTGAQLASELGISERTVRTKLSDFKEKLECHGATLEAKRRVGYRMVIRDAEAVDAWKKERTGNGSVIPTTAEERARFILSYLLEHNDYIKLEELSELLYISRNTVTADLKQVEELLKQYRLTIRRRPNYGIRLEGGELDRRLCIAKQLAKERRYVKEPDAESKLLRELLSDVVKEAQIPMTELSFRSMVLHLYVANERLRRGHRMLYTEEAREELRRELSPKALRAAERLAQELEKQFELSYDADEVLYLAIHLGGKVTSDAQREEPPELRAGQMSELARKMLEAVYESNRVDFRGDEELHASLVQHLIPLDTRLRFNIPLTNPILDHIKTEYSFAFVLAINACTVLREYYQKTIPQDEIGYIAILLGLAAEKRGRSYRKKNIVVVCASGRGTSQLLLYKCRQTLGKYLENIYEKTVYELPELDFKGLEIDCVLSTIPLNMTLPVPSCQVSPFLDGQEIERLERLFRQGDFDFLSHYFDPRLFIPVLDVKDKNEILKRMCDHAAQFKTMEPDFYSLVLKREEMGQTDFGNLVAIPHAQRIASPERFVMTAILKEPIWWGHNEVQVVFLVSLPESSDDTVESFYRAMLNFQTDPALVGQVIKEPTFQVLMQAFREAGQR